MGSSARDVLQPRCIVIGGPNGAGKTTFAREFLARQRDIVQFVNADLIAAGLSALRPQTAAVTAARIFLSELDRLAHDRAGFSFESTLSGRAYASRFHAWRLIGYRIEIIYLKIDSPRLALRRVATRVKQGGHDVPEMDVRRRFDRSWSNFAQIYRQLADLWEVYDNSGVDPQLLARGP